MAGTRHKCYQMPWGFVTIDTENPNDVAPEDYIAVFDVNMQESAQIDDGADLVVVDGNLIIDPGGVS